MAHREADVDAAAPPVHPAGDKLGATRLEKHAQRLADTHDVSRSSPFKTSLLMAHLGKQEAFLRGARGPFAATSKDEVSFSQSAEWFLDNFHIVQQALRQVREDLPEGAYSHLPGLENTRWEGYPRIYVVAGEVIKHCEGPLDAERLERFIRAYQRVEVLTIGELWALPAMLRLILLENLTEAVARCTGRPRTHDGDHPSGSWLDDVDKETAVSTSILSLQMLASQDWRVFFEGVSLVDQILHRDPAKLYDLMDFRTRDSYRAAIEELALATGREERNVAREALQLAQDEFVRAERSWEPADHASWEGDDNPAKHTFCRSGLSLSRTVHIGFYLLDAGRTQLEKRIGFCATWHMGRRRWLYSHPTPFYLGSIGLLTFVNMLAALLYAHIYGGTLPELIGLGVLFLVPATTVAVSLVNWLVTHVVPPRVLLRLDFQRGIPAECRTMVVIPALLTDIKDVKHLLHQLELHFLGNTDSHLHFALVTGFGDAPQKHMRGDDALLEYAQSGIRALNEKHKKQVPDPFYFFHRQRRWNPAEGCWMGWERKRGKLVEFNRLLSGDRETSYNVAAGDLEILPEVKYVITLDEDTSLPPDSARRLIATLAHPLNRAQFDPASATVTAGYTVLQPRIAIRPTSANRSVFTSVFAGDCGLDLYSRAVSDAYQDLFGEGIYVGKGIYDVRAFEQSLAGRVPDNALLSHDLFEGIHGRVGLVNDVVLYEEYPTNYLSFASRLRRWVRGDWQLLPWLLPRVPRPAGGRIRNHLSLLDRWKILDNLRRSLLSPTLLGLVVSGWLWLPGSEVIWTLTAAAIPSVALVTGMITGLARGGLLAAGSRSVLRDQMIRWLLSLAFLPYEALALIREIVITLIRLTVTHKNLLKWTTAAHASVLFGRDKDPKLVWMHMSNAPLLALGCACLIGLINLAALPAALPLLLAWLVSPQIAYWISRPVLHKRVPFSDDQRRQLGSLGRRSWFYFEQFVGPEDHWLVPDHFQEEPRGLVAHRTSPTNLGLMLLSTLAAYDLGYIGLKELALRLRSSFESMAKLEKYRGHFLNWYNTHDLKPLGPRYVSTVDSGNLAGCLLALEQGCLDVLENPLLRWQHFQGFLDTLDVLSETLSDLMETDLKEKIELLQIYLDSIRQQISAAQDNPDTWVSLLSSLSDTGSQELDRLVVSLVESSTDLLDTAHLHTLSLWLERVHEDLRDRQREVRELLPWLSFLSQAPQLFQVPETHLAITRAWRALVEALPSELRLNEISGACKEGQKQAARLLDLLTDEAGSPHQVQEARTWCMDLAERLDSARMSGESLLADYRHLSLQAEAYLQAMDFGFLFDSKRQVFQIGYNIEADELDSHYYDLLASEARIASFVAIAKGDVSQSHWLYLSRPLTQIDGTPVLLSWSGTMFEYLMPSLLMRRYEGTLLEQSCRAAVERQIEYARRQGVPWGISESGYYRFDANMNYQYRAFGVPGLGFKRGLGEDLVIAPYASILALPIRPLAVMDNIDDLIKLQMLGNFGLYEAIDYTRSRLAVGQKQAIVSSYMAHHQGMILVSVTNFLRDEIMVRRFHADPRVQTAELLLQEQSPPRPSFEQPALKEIGEVHTSQPQAAIEPWHVPVQASLPQAYCLSNGRYCVLITSAGSGYSCWGGVDLTRWRPDATLDDWGTWIYVKDCASGKVWSAGYQPTASSPDSQDVIFHPHKAEFRRRDHDISLHMDITVASTADAEIRRITLINHSNRPRQLRLTSYSEIILASQSTDQRHPAFNKLFIESEYQPAANALLFSRRPRSPNEDSIYLAHLLSMESEQEITGHHETDRLHFLGRGGTQRAPAVLNEDDKELSGTTGATLDPIMALSQEITLKPHSTVQVAYVTLAAESRYELLNLVDQYQAWPAIDEAFTQARSLSELRLRQLGFTAQEFRSSQQLLSALLYPSAALRCQPTAMAKNTLGQAGLWAYGISGDYPILLVRLGNPEQLSLVRELLRAHRFWRERQIKVDLVILDQKETGYVQELGGKLQQLITKTGDADWLNQPGGIFILRVDLMSKADRVLLESAARVVVEGDVDSLSEQLKAMDQRPTHLPQHVPIKCSLEALTPTSLPVRPTDLLFDNGFGGFSADGREYVIYLESGQWTPAPWINVIANPHFGFLVSESGAGYTWSENSGENRLTPWRNDPVTDVPGEALYLRDEETGEVWSPTPLPARASSPYLIRHGAGYSVFEHHSHGLKQRLCLFAVPDAPLKVQRLRLENTQDAPRRITATLYVEWVLGTHRAETQQYIVPEFDHETQTLLARNPYNAELGKRVAFLAASKELHGLTSDRREFLGRTGTLSHPVALGRVGLSGRVEAGVDPCAAIQVHIDLDPGEVHELYFLMGEGASRAEALRLVRQYQDPTQVEVARRAVNEFWDSFLGAVQVKTPDEAMNLLLNRWLLYQTLSCRIWGRSALYQSSGAFGYRDQLQDVMALMLSAPQISREHILAAARQQFEEGDVLHWWHPPSGYGVRTRCSDDLLWLPFVASQYVSTTGDDSILTEETTFLRGTPLAPAEHERYARYKNTDKTYSLYEHCLRAVRKGWTQGPNDLPLIAGGDWNDGMNLVGLKGQGESVWLGWFLYSTLSRFASLCELVDDDEQAARHRQGAREVREALEGNFWDGHWYQRARYDDSTPLGSAQNHECQIDSIAQSWAVLSGAGDPERATQAMDAVAKQLVRRDDQLILLFTPPFDRTPRDPGYIKAYPPGIRENGGQYTHAALWAVWAFADLGQGDRAEALFRLLNPIYHADTAKKVRHYRVEPYVVAADVYSEPPHTGRGGWTWYTGSAGWMYRLGLEAILGLNRRGKTLRINPCIPQDWASYELTYHECETTYQILVENPKGISRGVKQVILDGETVPGGDIPLLADGRRHSVRVLMGYDIG